MKRRITVEQLNELTDEQKQKLRDWWSIPNYGDFYTDTNLGEGCWMDPDRKPVQTINNCLPLLDIGQMIELLDPKEETIFTMCNMISAQPRIYEITVSGNSYFADNMCDALWEVVKKVL